MNAPSRIVAELDADTFALVERLAEAQGRTVDAFASDAIRRVAQGETDYRAFIQEGIDAADRGELISQTEMELWFEERIAQRRSQT